MTKKPEQATVPTDEAPGEFPVRGFEPLDVPKGFTIADLLRRVEALEQSQGVRKSSAKIDG